MVSTRAHDRGGPGVVGDGMPQSVLHVLKVEEREGTVRTAHGCHDSGRVVPTEGWIFTQRAGCEMGLLGHGW